MYPCRVTCRLLSKSACKVGFLSDKWVVLHKRSRLYLRLMLEIEQPFIQEKKSPTCVSLSFSRENLSHYPGRLTFPGFHTAPPLFFTFLKGELLVERRQVKDCFARDGQVWPKMVALNQIKIKITIIIFHANVFA